VLKKSATVTKSDQIAPGAGLAERVLAGHLEKLPGGKNRWALWKCVGLRGAGFAATNVLRLGSEDSGRAADELFAAEANAEQA